MPSSESAASSDVLSWRIPVGRGSTSLRFALIQIAFATVIVGFLVLFLAPAHVQAGLLSASIALALILAGYQVLRRWRELRGPANVWLDDAGLHWRDAALREQLLPRSLVRRFFVGHDEETRRERPSLSFLLKGGFVSQPVELHEPANEPVVRAWLQGRWSLEEAAALPDDAEVRLRVASQLDFYHQHWLLEGSREGLLELAGLWTEAAKFPLPPVGARPKQIIMELGGQSVALAVAAHTWIDTNFFAATPELLDQLASELRAKLRDDQSPVEFEIAVRADTGHHWRLAFATREE